jgi:choline dehydrogenase-like flavoprotein
MFLPQEQRPQADGYDCLIVGSGPAGMTVALELDRAGKRALVIESEAGDGDFAFSIGYGHYAGDYWNAHSLRALGGTSNAWAGWVATLREIDFDHPVIGVRWPLTRDDLVPFYRRAAPILRRRSVVVDFERDLMPGWLFRPFSLQPPTRFGDQFRGTIDKSPRLDVALGYSVVGFEATAGRSSITALRCFDHRTKAAFDLPVRPGQSVVVAAGGIGNAQLLLQPTPAGGPPIGNESGQVGRFLMEHPHAFGVAECVTDVDLLRYAPPGMFGRTADAIVLHPATEVERGLFGCSLTFTHKSAEHELAARFSADHGRPFYHYRLTARAEMRPSPANRVFLTAERSRCGLYRPAARCVIDADDFRSIEGTVRLLGETLLGTQRGRARFINDPLYVDIGGGGHIMGTTRMGGSASTSVVDRDCRVHGYNNFFVAGSSVFPTGGYANPTFTIVALAVRLADEIATRG